MDLKIDGTSLKRIASELKDFPEEIPKAVASAENRALAKAKTLMKRAATKNYDAKSAQVAKTIKLNKAKAKDLRASAVSKGGRLPLYYFKHSPKTPPPKHRYTKGKTYYKVKVKKSGGLSPVNGEKNRKGFLQKMPANDTYMFFARKQDKTWAGNKRLPIKKLFSLAIPQMIANKNATNAAALQIQREVAETLEKRVDHEIKYRLEKMASKSKKGSNR